MTDSTTSPSRARAIAVWTGQALGLVLLLHALWSIAAVLGEAALAAVLLLAGQALSRTRKKDRR